LAINRSFKAVTRAARITAGYPAKLANPQTVNISGAQNLCHEANHSGSQ
jgi:hypothetical protein